jgi:hypothetical protein
MYYIYSFSFFACAVCNSPIVEAVTIFILERSVLNMKKLSLNEYIDQARSIAQINIKGNFEFTFEKLKEFIQFIIGKKRTNSQNALYWMWLACIGDYTGDDKNDLHGYFRKRFLPFEEKTVIDEVKFKLTSTTDLNTAEFSAYMDKIQQFVLTHEVIRDFGIELPNPEDLKFEAFCDYYKDYI